MDGSGFRDSVVKELPFEMLNVSEFILDGPKEMLRQIKELHDGHYDEIAGVATVPPPPQDEDAAVVTSKKGPVRIAAGRRDEKGVGIRSAPQPIRLRVASLTHSAKAAWSDTERGRWRRLVPAAGLAISKATVEIGAGLNLERRSADQFHGWTSTRRPNVNSASPYDMTTTR